ncbi:MAG: FkbM family methyltransferase [Planctomycetota bacterium]
MIAWLAFAAAVVAIVLAERARRDAHTARRRGQDARDLARDASQAAVSASRSARQDLVERRLEELDLTPALPPVFRAGAGEDLVLFDLLRPLRDGATPGTFLEVGAYDGVRYSVTWIFEAIGWSGVLIEPIEHHAERCRASRPHSKVFHAALGAPGGPPSTTFTLLEPSENADTDTASFATTHETHRFKMRRSIVRASRSVEVPLRTMTDVLEEAFETPRSIDLAVIDVEGGEFDLLRGFDLDRFPPRVLLVEDLTAGGDTSVRDLLIASGYESVARIARNDLYIRSDERELIDRARILTTFV